MAPLALMSRSFLEELGGLDRRYICGQYENDIVMRSNAVGGRVKIFKDGYIELDHKNKHFGEGVNQIRSFALGYPNDRKVLETSWADGKKVLTERTDKFEPFKETEDWYFKSQANNKHIWE